MIGKFKTQEELLRGYEELEKQFTQKCQQLSGVSAQRNALADECESLKNQTKTTDGTSAEASPSNPDAQSVAPTTNTACVPEETQASSSSGENTEQLLQQFFADNPQLVSKLLRQMFQDTKSFAPSVMRGGGSVLPAVPSKPGSIKEATLMAKELFKN